MQDWSAVEPDDVQEWMRQEGTTNEPGGGSAALQLQSWLDDVNGGWPNSFA